MSRANFYETSEHYVLDKRHSCRNCNDFEFCCGRMGWSSAVTLDCGRCGAHCWNCDDAELMAERELKRKNASSMSEIHNIDRLAKAGANEFCGLTLEEVKIRSPDVSKLARVQVDRNTIIFYDPAKTSEKKIKDKHNMYLKRKKYETQEIY